MFTDVVSGTRCIYPCEKTPPQGNPPTFKSRSQRENITHKTLNSNFLISGSK
jgi:hypothetical protein